MTSRKLHPLRVCDLVPAVSIKADLTLKLCGIQYLLIDHKPDSFLNLDTTPDDPTAFVVFPVADGDTITDSFLATFRSHHLDTDDIFQPAFLQNIIFYGSEEATFALQPSATSLLATWNTTTWQFVKSSGEKSGIALGPYVSYHGRIWEPWRIYADDNLSMMVSFKPDRSPASHGTLIELDNILTTDQIRAVVPSRSYSSSKNDPSKPLLGVRIAVKDIFDIKNVRTSLCNRAWTEYQELKSETAASVQHLQDLGAVIVGKTRLNAMVIREEPMECVEFLAPFNPRGDGYQTPAGSSTGSCVALAAYPWLDFSLGSDTNGSSRKPAYWMGCYSIRPTTGVLDTHGVASFCSFYDVPAFFGRDISRFHDFASLWYGKSPKLSKSAPFSETSPKILYLTDYLPTPNAAQMGLIDSFVEDLEVYLGVPRTRVSLADMWRQSCPESAKGIELPDYLETAATLPYYKDACGLLKVFVDGYKEKFGKAPFFHRALRWRWEQADKVTPDERDEGWARIYAYKKWLLDTIFNEDTVLVLPIDNGLPYYRETMPPPFGLLSGYHPLYLSPIAGTPEVTAPIGEISYHSEVTQRLEPLPISVSVVSAPGTDLNLIDLVHEVLKKGKKPVEVATGRSIFKNYS